MFLWERISRRDSRKVIRLKHGILDSSMGWVSNGVVLERTSTPFLSRIVNLLGPFLYGLAWLLQLSNFVFFFKKKKEFIVFK